MGDDEDDDDDDRWVVSVFFPSLPLPVYNGSSSQHSKFNIRHDTFIMKRLIRASLKTPRAVGLSERRTWRDKPSAARMCRYHSDNNTSAGGTFRHGPSRQAWLPGANNSTIKVPQ